MAVFSIDLANFAEKAKLNATTVMKKVALDCYIRVAMRTPVDTGRARGGWQMSGSGIGSGDSGALDPTPTGTPNPGFAGADVSSIGEEGAFIFNNVVYIIPLEYGHSKQAPAGMVRVTVAEFNEMIAAATAGMG